VVQEICTKRKKWHTST